jgi:hypothetical protein
MKSFIKIGGLLLALSQVLHAQVNQAELATITMLPISGRWLATKMFQYAGDYGYYQDNTPMAADGGQFLDLTNWRWAYYTGLTGKRVIAYGTWGLPKIGPPVLRSDGKMGDNCGHAHTSYGVWLAYGLYSGGKYYSGWTSGGGGSKSGTRVNNNYCKFSTTSDLEHIDKRYGWGAEQFDYKFPAVGNIFYAMVVGVTAVSHGGFGCTSFGCVNQPYIVSYSLPY